jgi:hypothetical protein
LPGAIIAFLGLGRTGGFLRGSFRARLSTLVSLVIALLGTVASVVVERDDPYSPTLLSEDMTGALDPIVAFAAIVIGVQLLNTAWIIGLWLYRSYVYWAARTSYTQRPND